MRKSMMDGRYDSHNSHSKVINNLTYDYLKASEKKTKDKILSLIYLKAQSYIEWVIGAEFKKYGYNLDKDEIGIIRDGVAQKFIFSLDSYNSDKSKPITFITTIAKNETLDYLKSKYFNNIQLGSSINEDETQKYVSDSTFAFQSKDAMLVYYEKVNEAKENLPEPERKLINLIYYDEYCVDSACRELGVQRSQFFDRKAKSLKFLREILTKTNNRKYE